MKCELCNKNDAETVFFRPTPAGGKEELYVCHACFNRERAFLQPHGIQVAAMEAPESHTLTPPAKELPGISQLSEELLKTMRDFFGVNSTRPHPTPEECDESPECPKCGMTFREISTSHTAGCPECYSTFRDAFAEMFTEQQGKAATCTPPPPRKQKLLELNRLKQAFNEALATEDFNKAKQLKAAISALTAALEATEHQLGEDDEQLT